ncbi:DUF2218 domain-containing protein [Sphingomonas sp.]|uniref:DUF2218 domain-containing protein n=1 Tax=Sphingomonas sp. TaxID=28214 RepID=UPI003B001A0A
MSGVDPQAPASATAAVPTAQASRYLQRLCKHWSHNLAVDFDERAGRVTFPRDARGASWASDGEVRFAAHDDRLDVTVNGSSAAQVEALEEVVARHLDRFAFREAPLTFAWTVVG